jgi:ABC-2 type transport system permease protein
MTVLKILSRLLAFVGKEMAEVVRRPSALASLVLGPFLIMIVFGLGYVGHGQPLSAAIVVPEGSRLPTDLETYREFEDEGIRIRAVTTNVDEARAMLRDGDVEIAVIAPADAPGRFEAGEQSVIGIEYATVDPIKAGWVAFVGQQLSAEVNREIIRRLVEEGQEFAVVRLNDPEVTRIPADVIAAPTRSAAENLAPTSPGVVPFYGAAIVALILQHLAMTLAALSLVKERTTGAIDVFRIAPVGAAEVVVGKLLGFAALVAVVAVATMAILVGVVGVPMLSGPLPVAAVMALLSVGSIGIGLLLAAISDSERQAVQLTLLVLLTSIFFSGLVLPLSDFAEPIRVAANVLPVTHGMRLLQDLLLTGGTGGPWRIAILGGVAAGSLLLAWLLLRRSMAAA